MEKYDKDNLVDPEDIICDGIYEAVEIKDGDLKIDADKFFNEVRSRSKNLRIELAFEILWAKDRYEFEEMVHELYMRGVK